MPRQATHNHDMGYFHAPSTRSLVTRNLGRGVVSFTRLRAPEPLGQIDDSAIEDAILIAYQHRPIRCDVFLEDRHVPVPGESQDRFTMYDYRHRWSGDIRTPYAATNFYIPRAILDTVSQAAGPSGDLLLKPGQSADDPVVRGIVAALDGAFEDLARPNVLFLDHLGWALAAHCVQTYLEGAIRATHLGGLAPWQKRLSTEMIDARLDGEVRLFELAQACGLSVSHFARAFQVSTGMPPHRWLIGRRIAAAQHLLLSTDQPISDIAVACGFHDQSHLTRTFTRKVGAPPAAWRRARRS